MPKLNPAAALAGRLLDELAACRAADDYPVALDRLLKRVEPHPNPEEVAKALARKEFTSRAVVTVKDRPDAPVAFLEDGDRLAESPLVLEAALRKLGGSSEPPWTIAKLAGALPNALRPRIRVGLADQIAAGRLPPFAATVKKGSAVRLYHRDHPPPPPPLPKEAVLAERLVELVRQQKTAGPAHYPLTVRQLADRAGVSTTDAVFRKALKAPALTEQIVLTAWKNAEAPLTLREDVSALAGSGRLLHFLLGACERLDAHAFPIKDLLARVEDPKPRVKNPLKAALQAWLETDDLDRCLPAGVGFVLVGAGKKAGQRYFLRPEHLRTGRGAPAPVADTPPPAAAPSMPFTEAFEAAFTRLDREAGSNNFVSLVRLRQALPGVPRTEFDAQLRLLRRAGRFRLKAAEGLDGISPEERAAGIPEEGELLLNVSRAQP